jgi:transketolase
MRAAFVRTLMELAEKDSRVLLLTGDLGYMALEPFADRFPDRFFNVGVAEQNLVGVATGLAEAGFIPYVYSIVPFAVLRPYEFIRNGPILHRLPVRIVGMGGGMEYGHDGASHYGLEDVGTLRIQPGITVIVPADAEQARTAIQATWELNGPVYYRLGKDDKTIIPGLDGRFELGRSQLIGNGADLLFISMGNIASQVSLAIDTLAAQGLSCTMMIIASLNPAPVEDLVSALDRFPVALTVEAHYDVGGLGSWVSEIVAERALSCRVIRCGVHVTPDGITGQQSYMWHRHGLSSEKLVATALQAIQNPHPVIYPAANQQ